MRRFIIILCVFAAIATSISWAGEPARKVRVLRVDPANGVVRDMAEPEGTTRWDLRGLVLTNPLVRTVEIDDQTVVVTEEGTQADGKAALSTTIYSDPTGGDAALRWYFPDRDRAKLQPGSHEELRIDQKRDGRLAGLRIDIDTVGVGWVHLASGPREVALQRVHVEGGLETGAPRLLHRWVDPLAGSVAEIWGTPSGDGRKRLDVGGGEVVDQVLLGAADLKIYLNQLWGNPFERLNYGWDKGAGTLISSLTPQGYATMGALIAANSWDFSGITSGTEIAQTSTSINASETCNYDYPSGDPPHPNGCGYPLAGAQLERTDKAFDNPSLLDKTNDVALREDRPGDPTPNVTIWIRAGAQHEGKSGTFGTGESRFCYWGTDLNGKTRTQVPLWRFTHQDANGWYFQTGDSWTGTPFACEQNIFNQLCGAAQFFDKIYTTACGSHTGTQSSAVLKGGVVTLPSGHTFNALLVRNLADFCVYIDRWCALKVDEVRTSVYLWQVPFNGSVVTLQSPQNPADTTSFTTLDMTNINYGLFPPRTISVTGQTTGTVSLSWDPGLDTHRINGYRVYWDTDSGGSSPYAYDSINNSSQVSFNGTTATISGLGACTTYYFTLTSRSTFTDPSTLVPSNYESIVYPSQVYGDPSYVYPVEVQATTTYVPAQAVTGMTVSKVPEGIEICWNASTEPCLTGYRILGATSPTAYANYTTVADTGVVTCWRGNPTQSYFLVSANGTGGTGPCGHYGH